MTRHNDKSNARKVTQGFAARKLGVTREHLNRVLNGKRQSRSLLNRYNALLKTAA